jgi:hypothetical protein
MIFSIQKKLFSEIKSWRQFPISSWRNSVIITAIFLSALIISSVLPSHLIASAKFSIASSDVIFWRNLLLVFPIFSFSLALQLLELSDHQSLMFYQVHIMSTAATFLFFPVSIAILFLIIFLFTLISSYHYSLKIFCPLLILLITTLIAFEIITLSLHKTIDPNLLVIFAPLAAVNSISLAIRLK